MHAYTDHAMHEKVSKVQIKNLINMLLIKRKKSMGKILFSLLILEALNFQDNYIWSCKELKSYVPYEKKMLQ